MPNTILAKPAWRSLLGMLLLFSCSSVCGQICEVCGDDKVVGFPRAVVMVPTQPNRTCAEYEDLGLAGNFTETNCGILQPFITDKCSCRDSPVPAPDTPAPVTPAPIDPPTPAPITPAPVTPAPVTVATPAPVTPAPVTPAPVTPAPVTPAPVTPETPAPVTPAPVTPAPVTPAPVTPAPVTPAPVTPAPVTPAPVTDAPTPAPVATPAPDTPAPDTPAPDTPAPDTPAPDTPAPVSGVTSAPTPMDTLATTMEPTASPTEKAATGEPTAVPVTTADPTGMSVPSIPETSSPTVMEDTETSSPTGMEDTETPSPTEMKDTETSSPTSSLLKGTLTSLEMTLLGITDMPIEDQDDWKSSTETYNTDFYAFADEYGVLDLVTEITIDDVVPSRRKLLRGLKGDDEVTIVYSQEMTYRGTDPDFSLDDVATTPYSNKEFQDAYVNFLNGNGQGVLADVSGVSPVTVPDGPGPTETPVEAPTDAPTETEDEDSSLSTGAIIAIAVAGGALVIGLLLYFFFMSGSRDEYEASDPPPNVNVKAGGDEVSTLAPPQVRSGAPTGDQSLAGYGDQSVATVDYDYSKAYGGAGDTSVSSAGGTFGSNTHNQSALDPATAAATGAALGGAGGFGDADSFEDHYRDPNANVKEELLNIFAPPGKLGVVIDTPDDGAPVVHAVKDSSVIADKIHVGDKLVAVDDEDVRSMTAIKVSKLISRKSANPSRKLTIIRTSVM